MKEHTKLITLSDRLEASLDAVSMSKGGGGGGSPLSFHTEVTMRDQDGRVCFAKRSNLIVLRGRTFTLELLFGDTIGSNGVNTGDRPYLSDNARKVMAFAVGKGGAPTGDPFTPYAPVPTGLWLADPIPFRLHDTAAVGDGDPLTYIPVGEVGNYGGGAAVSGFPTQTEYFIKHYTTRDVEWFHDADTNTVYKKIELSISATDCRTAVSNVINELSLVFTRETGVDANGCATFANAEMFSRITFPTEFISDNKALDIEYRIYA